MLTEKVKYQDFDGEWVEETLYFNLTNAEALRLQNSERGPGGLYAKLQRILKENNPADLIGAMEMIIKASYGTRGDNNRFVKNPVETEIWMTSESYSAFFFDLLSDAKKAERFVSELLPKGKITEAADRISKAAESRIADEDNAQNQPKANPAAWRGPERSMAEMLQERQQNQSDN